MKWRTASDDSDEVAAYVVQSAMLINICLSKFILQFQQLSWNKLYAVVKVHWKGISPLWNNELSTVLSGIHCISSGAFLPSVGCVTLCSLYIVWRFVRSLLLVITWVENNISSCYYSCLSGIVKRRTGNGQFTCGPRLQITGERQIDTGETRWKRVFLQPTSPSPVHSSFQPLPPVPCILSFWYAFSPVGRRCQVVCSQPAKLSLTCRLQVYVRHCTYQFTY